MEDLLFEREIDICHETVRLWWNRFGLLLATGHGWFRSTVVSGLTGFLAAIGIITAYFIVGSLVGKLMQ